MGGLRVRSFLTTLPHGQPHPVFRGLTPFLEGGWEEAEDSPGITMQHTLNINISLQAWCSCWCQCHVTHPSQGDSREPLTPSFGDRTLLHCLLPEVRVALHGQGTEAARSALPILISVCSIFLRPFSLSGFGIFNMHTDVDACGCTDTVRQSAPEVDWEKRKITCRTGDSNPRQYYAWLFSRTLEPLSCRRSFASALIQQVLHVMSVLGPRGKRVYVSTPLAWLGLWFVRWTKWFLWCVVLSVCCPLYLAVNHVGTIISLFGQFSSRSAVPL